MNTPTLPLFGHAHRDQFVRGEAWPVVDQYRVRDGETYRRLSDDFTADTSTGVYFAPLAAGGPLDAPCLPRGSFARSRMCDYVVLA